MNPKDPTTDLLKISSFFKNYYYSAENLSLDKYLELYG